MKHLEAFYKSKNKSLLYFIGIIIISFVIQLIVSVIEVPFLIAFSGYSLREIPEVLHGDTTTLFYLHGKNIALLLLMLPIVITLFATIFLIKSVENLSFSEVVNGRNKTRVARILWGFGVWMLLSLPVLLIQLAIFPDSLVFQFDLARFIPLVFIAVLLIPLQVTYEEILFRGILAQGIGGKTQNRLLALIVPALAFMAMHLMNPEVKEHGLFIMIGMYLAMGLLLGLVSILDDGIELAIGIHAANNIFVALFTTQKNSVFETYAVFEVIQENYLYSFISLCVVSAIVIGFFYKKYNWHFSTLFVKVEKRVI